MTGERHLGPVLLTATLCAPAVFCWLLLRRGYAASLRRAAFTYAGAMTAIGIIGQLSR